LEFVHMTAEKPHWTYRETYFLLVLSVLNQFSHPLPFLYDPDS
jgi:hypothetical protein